MKLGYIPHGRMNIEAEGVEARPIIQLIVVSENAEFFYRYVQMGIHTGWFEVFSARDPVKLGMLMARVCPRMVVVDAKLKNGVGLQAVRGIRSLPQGQGTWIHVVGDGLFTPKAEREYEGAGALLTWNSGSRKSRESLIEMARSHYYAEPFDAKKDLRLNKYPCDVKVEPCLAYLPMANREGVEVL